MRKFSKDTDINKFYKVCATYRLIESKFNNETDSYVDEWPECNGYILREADARHGYSISMCYIHEWIEKIKSLNLNNIGIIFNNKNYVYALSVLEYEFFKNNIKFTLIFEGADGIPDGVDFN
jgi:hypothetical protein